MIWDLKSKFIAKKTKLKKALSPYGETKKICEDIIKTSKIKNYHILRYFNPIGAHKSSLIGENPKNKPKAATFDNKYNYSEMLVEKDITLYSTCEHHFLPIVGKAHIAYISSGNVIGLSKMNRIVEYYAKRPQVQERLTKQIVKELQEALGTDDVACVIDAKHLCVNSRGIKDVSSSTVTSEFGGKFKYDSNTKEEFLKYIQLDTSFNGI